jgi:aspartate racemase
MLSQMIPESDKLTVEPEWLQLSFAQERIWVYEQLEQNSATYNVPFNVRLEGPLNVVALERSINEILRRHDILRARFAEINGHPVQAIGAYQPLPFLLVDLQSLNEAARADEVTRLSKEEAQRPFDLSQGPLLRVRLLRCGETDHVLLRTMHHIACDGWSISVFTNEMAALYAAFSEGKPSPLTELPMQYSDYVHRQRQRMQGKIIESEIGYWKQRLGGDLPILALPTDRPRPERQTYHGARHRMELPADFTAALRSYSRENRVTLFMVLFAAYATFLHRYTNQNDILIGAASADRMRVETRGLIGFLINVVVLRSNLSGNPGFHQFLARVREMALGAYAHQDIPPGQLLETLRPPRDARHNPIFQTMLAMEPPMYEPEMQGLESTQLKAVDTEMTAFDLILQVIEKQDRLTCFFIYNTDLFNAGTVQRMALHFQVLLRGILANPEQKLSRLPLLTDTEQYRISMDWNCTQTDYPREKCIHNIFEDEVERNPDANAVTCQGVCLTYHELNQRANQLAHHLCSLGVGTETLVGICLDRSAEMIVGLLGILKAGAAYVPLDQNYPEQRLSYLLTDTQLPVLVTTYLLLQKLPQKTLPDVKIVCMDSDSEILERLPKNNISNTARPDNLAYVMYTSGSTGRPKGVCIVHRGVVRLVKETDYARFGSNETFLQFAPIAFDASTFEIWGSLLNGGRLVIAPAYFPSLKDLGHLLRREHITTLWLTSSLFKQMADEQMDDLRGLRQLLVGGDVLPVAQAAKALAHLDCTLINGYGPTENTTFTCYHVLRRGVELKNNIPVGRPVANTQVYILDAHMQTVPIGVVGEIYIGGDGLARGYLNQPALTSERFIVHSVNEHMQVRLYKSGDLARYLPDGTIEFLGRVDHQVKIRGFRIEPGEIEIVLRGHPAIHDALVVAGQDVHGDKRLIAYVVRCPEQIFQNAEVITFLQQRLPEYMLPAQLISLARFPLTSNGKIDRQALPAPEQNIPGIQNTYLAARDGLEFQLTGVWEQVLGCNNIGIMDNFFALGGHSLSAVRMLSQVNKLTGKNISLSAILHAPTIEKLAALLREESSPDLWPLLVPIQTGTSRSIFFYVPGSGGNLTHFRHLAPYLTEQTFFAFQPPGLDGRQRAFDRMDGLVSCYLEAMLKLQPEGPYFLGGWCIGGLVALEMARQLQAQGKSVALLVLFEAPMQSGSSTSGRIKKTESYSPMVNDVNPGEALTTYFDKAVAYISIKLNNKRRKWSRRLLKSKNRITYRLSILGGFTIPAAAREQYLMDADVQIMRNYVPRAYPGKITYFCSSKNTRRYANTFHQDGWAQLAPGGVALHEVEGDHRTMFLEPFVQSVARQLATCMSDVRGNSEAGPADIQTQLADTSTHASLNLAASCEAR